MSLTVPKAGLSAGAVASAPQVDVPRTGEMIADFGQRLLQVGARIQQERDQRGLERARVAMASGLNDLQTKYQQIGDPDEIDRGYAEDAAALRSQIVDSVPESVRDQVGTAFDGMNVSYAAGAGRRAVQLRQSSASASIAALGEEVVRSANGGDTQATAAAMAQYDQQVQGAVARGVMTPEEAQRHRQQITDRSGQTRATRTLSDDPRSLVAAIDAGEYAHMSGEDVAGLRSRAVAAAEADAARAAAEAQRARKAQVDQAQALFRDGIAVAGTGRDFARAADADALLKDPEIAATPEAREYVAARDLRHAMPGFAVLPPAEKRKALAEARQGGIEKAYDNDRVRAMETAIEADEKGFAEDPLGRAVQIGLGAPPPLPDLASASDDDLVAGLSARGSYGRALSQMGYTKNPAFFTAAERETLKARVGVNASPADRAQLAKTLSDGLGQDAPLAAAEIGADPVFAHVGGGLAHGMSVQLGRQIFEGQRVIEGKQVQLPPELKRNQAFFHDLSGLFGDGTDAISGDMSGMRNTIIAATDALYAYRQRGKVQGSEWTPDAPVALDAAAYLQAAHEVMGGTGSYDRSDAKGGVQEVKGALTMLPQGIGADQVEDALDRLEARAGDPEAWRAISASGNVPDLGGQPMDARTLRSLTLRATGPDAYTLLRHRADGRTEVVMGDDHEPVQIGISALLKLGAAP